MSQKPYLAFTHFETQQKNYKNKPLNILCKKEESQISSHKNLYFMYSLNAMI